MDGIITRTFNGADISKRADGFVSATAACKAFGKEFSAYRRLDSTEEYLKHASKLHGKDINDLVYSTRSIGTWVHPSVALDLARWLCREFAVWMDAWFLEESSSANQHPPPTSHRLYKNQLEIRTETQLHESVASFIRDRFPDALILPSLGETGDTKEKRLANWRKGYQAGTPDLLVLMRHPRHVGLALEFKHPGGLGTTSEKQDAFVQGLKTQGWLTLVSDNFTDIILVIHDYIREASSVVCPSCQKQCTSASALAQHVRSVHSSTDAKRRRPGDDDPSSASAAAT